MLFDACQRQTLEWAEFRPGGLPAAPNYGQPVLPQRADDADQVPLKSPYRDGQDSARADALFIHPTVYTGHPNTTGTWNADLRDLVLNRTVDKSTILNRASVFNSACRVYAPSRVRMPRGVRLRRGFTPRMVSTNALL